MTKGLHIMAFFKDLGHKISDKSRELSQKARVMSEMSSLNNIIRNEESRIDFQYKEIGKKYFEKYGDSPEEGFREAFEQINECRQKIEQTQAEITKLKTRFNCPNCGAPFKHDSLFCAKCGTKLPEREEGAAGNIPDGAQRCPKCNNILKGDALFCNECGTKLEPQENSSTEEKTEEELLTAPVYSSKEDKQPEVQVKEDDASAAEINDIEEELVFTKKCPKCGNDMCEDDMFCNECGAKYE